MPVAMQKYEPECVLLPNRHCIPVFFTPADQEPVEYQSHILKNWNSLNPGQ